MLPSVSVIIPFFNRFELLREAIHSVINQTFQDFEIIAVDDGSTQEDESLLLFDDHRIKIVRQPNQGAAAARNLGIKHAVGRYVAFLDSDDIFLPEKLEKQVNFMEAHPEVMFCHTSYSTGSIFSCEEKRVDSGTFSGRCYPDILFNCPIATPTVMVRREILNYVSFEEKFKLGEDIILWANIAKTHNIYGINEALTKVRTSASSASNSWYKQVIGNYNILSYFCSFDRKVRLRSIWRFFLLLLHLSLPKGIKHCLGELKKKMVGSST